MRYVRAGIEVAAPLPARLSLLSFHKLASPNDWVSNWHVAQALVFRAVDAFAIYRLQAEPKIWLTRLPVRVLTEVVFKGHYGI